MFELKTRIMSLIHRPAVRESQVGAPLCGARTPAHRRRRRVAMGALVTVLTVAACAVGPNYHKPSVEIPDGFKEGTDWRRAEANPSGALASTWWTTFQDDTLNQLIEDSLKANQSIAAAEAAYRLAKATVDANVANLYPTIGAGLSASRASYGAGASDTGTKVIGNEFVADLSLSWELDLWGQIRREIESARAAAEASDAQLAGERLSIASSVALDYFALRQADIDVDLLKQQQDIYQRILVMTQAEVGQGTASNDDLLVAQDNLEVVVANLQSAEISREQYEHAIAVLVGKPPEAFSLPPKPSYAFVQPTIPTGVPSELLERRYDVVSAERTAASANARIGVAEAAFYPSLTLSAEAGFEHGAINRLFSVPNRFWTLGPSLAETLFDGGARTAAVREARATFDEQVANYRQAVLSAFQTVEDSLSSVTHLTQQEKQFAGIYKNNRQLLTSEEAQVRAGSASEQSLLTQKLTLLQAQENLEDTQAALSESEVTLIKNLGGGWQWDSSRNAPASAAASPAAPTDDRATGVSSQ
jgi:NodT family efflux transporter outer membrane factor (OMF) lipoprotein